MNKKVEIELNEITKKYNEIFRGCKNSYTPNINWRYITIEFSLSNDFMEEFRHKLDWGLITYCQGLSTDFIRYFKHKFN